ncbi:hypothetical protein EBZ38_07930 [bacterium]|nr:hypothetical protein [bacterium]
MPKLFKRLIFFEVEGELYDDNTKPENILKSYTWRFKGYHDKHGEDKCFLEASHNHTGGKITNLTFKSITHKPSTFKIYY